MMSRLVKIVDNKYVQIEEHINPNICFNTIEYDNFEDYCTLRETFDPFEMFYENQKYKEVIDKIKELIIDNIEEKTYEYIGSNKIKVLQNLIMDNDGVNELLDILKEVK